MNTNPPPVKLSPTHQLMAYYIASGKSKTEVARLTGYHVNRVVAVAQAPLFRALVADIQRDMRERTVDGVVERIIGEGDASVARIVQLRDSAESEPVQLAAAKDLLDRNPQTARVAKHEQDTTVRVSLDGAAMVRLASVIDEDEGRGTVIPAIAAPIGVHVRRLEDVLAESEDESA